MPQIQIFLSEDSPIFQDLSEEKITIGRLADNSLQIEDASVSSHHAELVQEEGSYHLRDLGSTNGTFVNEEQVEDVILNHGDEIRFGRIPAIYTAEEEVSVSQPLPETAGASASVETAHKSARPAGFVSSSPIPRDAKGKDILAMALYAGTVLAIGACAAAVYYVISLQTTAI